MATTQASTTKTLSINNIEVVYNSVILVLRGITLQVEPGKVVSLLGPNGAGKSTTLKAISGLLHSELGEVTRGQITWGDERIDNQSPEDIVRKGLVQVIEGRLYSNTSLSKKIYGSVAWCTKAVAISKMT